MKGRISGFSECFGGLDLFLFTPQAFICANTTVRLVLKITQEGAVRVVFKLTPRVNGKMYRRSTLINSR